MSSESLINKWRPASFAEIVGQDNIVKSFKHALDDRTSHAFLFTGPAGCGKTSLARLGAGYIGTSPANLIEVDAATYSGIDDMRSLTETLSYRPLGRNTTKSLVIDECHAVSRQAWQSLLKKVEEPPEWVMWFFCTTDVAKVPDTIKSRCTVYTLKPLRVTELFDFLEEVVKAEKFTTSRQIIELCAKMSEGSPRKALANLSTCYSAEDRKEAAKLIADLEQEQIGTPFALAQAIANGFSWEKVQPILASLAEEEVNAETIRHTVRSYFTKIVIGAKNPQTACAALKVLDNFSEPCHAADGLSPIVVAVGRSLFSS
jgi:DNA polymerase-3 subunit gamma/tau